MIRLSSFTYNRVAFSIFFVLCILCFQSSWCAEWSDEEIEAMGRRAEETVRKAYTILWEFRLQHNLADTVRDPERTGVIGIEHSPITTTFGYADSKLVSTKPGWASWLVKDLAMRGLWRHADVAVSFSGSFPALNIAVLAALQELDVDVKGISSVGASSWGANEPGLSWPEMECILREGGVLKVSASAVTLGGTSDNGAEWNDYARGIAMESVKRSRLPILSPRNIRDAVKKRMRFYGNPKDYAIYINVGGGHASMGGGVHVRHSQGGWYFEPLKEKGDPDGVIDNFLKAGVPCLNLLYIENLNQRENIVQSE